MRSCFIYIYKFNKFKKLLFHYIIYIYMYNRSKKKEKYKNDETGNLLTLK